MWCSRACKASKSWKNTLASLVFQLKKDEFQRSKLQLEERHDLALAGIVLIAIIAFLFLSISYQLVFLFYAVMSIFVFSTYIILWMDGAKKEPWAPEPKKWPVVSVIIPSFNTRETIFKCIKACKAMVYPGKFEIMVVEDGSTDGSYELLKKTKGIRLLKNKKNLGKAAALNFGLTKAQGEIVVCIDSDTYPQKDTMRKSVKHFYEKGNVGSVVLLVCVNEPKTLLQRIQQIEYWVSFGFFFRVAGSINSIYVTPGPTSFYRKSVLKKLGGYDEKNISEDLEIALRMQKAGYKIGLCHSTHVSTDVPDTLPKWFKQRLRWYRGAIMNMLRYIDLFFNRKYGDFGLFVLPTMLGSGFFAALFIAWTLFFWGRNLLDWLAPFAFDLSAGFTAGTASIGYGLLIFQSAWILGLFSISIWTYFLLKSFEISKTKARLGHIIPLMLLLWVYPLFIGFTFLVSYLQEMFGAKYTW